MSTQAAAQHEQAADQYGHAARPSMDEERIQMVVDSGYPFRYRGSSGTHCNPDVSGSCGGMGV
jgi:hypothetical protein